MSVQTAAFGMSNVRPADANGGKQTCPDIPKSTRMTRFGNRGDRQATPFGQSCRPAPRFKTIQPSP
jgi:hypothetical protein